MARLIDPQHDAIFQVHAERIAAHLADTCYSINHQIGTESNHEIGNEFVPLPDQHILGELLYWVLRKSNRCVVIAMADDSIEIGLCGPAEMLTDIAALTAYIALSDKRSTERHLCGILMVQQLNERMGEFGFRFSVTFDGKDLRAPQPEDR